MKTIDYNKCEEYFGMSFVELLKLQQTVSKISQNHSIPTEIYCKVVTLDMALKGAIKLFK